MKYASVLIKKDVIDLAQTFVALLLCLAASAQTATGQFLEISAAIELTSYRSGQTDGEANAKPRLVSLRCITGTNLWRIESDWARGGANNWFFDGTNVYESLEVTRPPSEERQEKLQSASGFAPVSFEKARSNLTINIWPSADGHPLGDTFVNLTWLAFCSGAYLLREGRLIPLTCDILRHTPDRYAYSDKTETFPDALGLPRSVDLYLSKSLYLSSVEDFYKGWGSRHLGWMRGNVTNLHEGVLTFHYSVTSTTNFLSWTVPLRFEFFQKGRDFIQNGNWFKRGVGTLISMREVARPKGPFNPDMQQTVVDWRFRDTTKGLDANVYSWTNAFVPQTQDSALQAKFKARIEQARRHKEAEK